MDDSDILVVSTVMCVPSSMWTVPKVRFGSFTLDIIQMDVFCATAKGTSRHPDKEIQITELFRTGYRDLPKHSPGTFVAVS
ncbi:hypothetical protein AV530_015607 [Patagioenas fasciata monilis]|uniref:Uncharacterized protein n=1 Tax=Patagioenas fasciata monilis TaxID=372326 RepID=A0A1V4KI45_PATFA|nr:hypothetical protein AV530_015607 [Patagioenas fasciata monilis]